MKRLIVIISASVLFVALVFAIALTVPAKNLIGNMLDYPECPNCENSLFWINAGIVKYGISKTIEEQDTGMFYTLVLNRGVLICTKCLYDLKSLDSIRIANKLLLLGYSTEEIYLIIDAVNNYKRESAI